MSQTVELRCWIDVIASSRSDAGKRAKSKLDQGIKVGNYVESEVKDVEKREGYYSVQLKFFTTVPDSVENLQITQIGGPECTDGD